MDPCHSFRRVLLTVVHGVLLVSTADAQPQSRVAARLQADVAVVQSFRPQSLWQRA